MRFKLRLRLGQSIHCLLSGLTNDKKLHEHWVFKFFKKTPRLKFCGRSDLTQSAVDFNFKQLAGTHLIEIVVSYITGRLRKHDSSFLSIRINFKRFAVSWQVTHDPHRHLTPVTVSTLPSSHDLKKVNPATRKKIWIY